MPTIFNTNTILQEKEEFKVSDYSWATSANLAKMGGLNDFALNVRTLEPGQFSCPYHFHHNAEEMFIIIFGTGELRIPEGIKIVIEGDVILFEKGASGAHQLYNNSKLPLIYMDFKTNHELDICEYPDSGKVNILPKGQIFEKGEEKDYFDGEADIKKTWERLKR